MSKEIIEKVYSVYGNEIPDDRHLYQATEESPVTILEIKKAFGSYDKFRQAYLAKVMDARKTKVTEKSKGAKNDETKK